MKLSKLIVWLVFGYSFCIVTLIEEWLAHHQFQSIQTLGFQVEINLPSNESFHCTSNNEKLYCKVCNGCGSFDVISNYYL
jgi:hypothetical protein